MCEPDYDDFLVDLTDENETIGEDRERLLASLRRFLDARSMQADWDEIREVSTSTLINTLSMIGSFTAGEKQALLEAPEPSNSAPGHSWPWPTCQPVRKAVSV